MLLLEDNQLQCGNSNFAWCQAVSHHPIIYCFSITTHPVMF